MEQARNYVCKSCSTPVPQGHKFCGRCGESVPPEILGARTLFFSDMQNPAKAKLILIRGEGMDGLSFHLKAEQHVVGRNGQLVFPDDPFISPKHANFFYRDGRLVVRDEGSLNGVYLRVRGTVEIVRRRSVPRGRAALPPRHHASRVGRTRARRHVLLLVSQAHQPVPHHADPARRDARHGRLRARQCAADRARGRGPRTSPATSTCRARTAASKRTAASSRITDMNSRNGTYIR